MKTFLMSAILFPLRKRLIPRCIWLATGYEYQSSGKPSELQTRHFIHRPRRPQAGARCNLPAGELSSTPKAQRLLDRGRRGDSWARPCFPVEQGDLARRLVNGITTMYEIAVLGSPSVSQLAHLEAGLRRVA